MAIEPSAGAAMIGPSVAIRTAVRPGPFDSDRFTGTSSRSASHIASSSTLGLNSSPATSTASTSQVTWSRAAASIERQG